MAKEEVAQRFSLNSISRKITACLALILVVFIGYISHSLYQYQSLKDDSVLIDIAGRQRLISQGITYHAGKVVELHTESVPTLRESIGLYESSLSLLKKGGTTFYRGYNDSLHPPPQQLQPILREIENVWLPYKNNALLISNNPLNNEEQKEAAKEALLSMEQQAPLLIEKNDDFVKAYVVYNQKKQQRTLIIGLCLTALSLLTVFFMRRTAKKEILIPIKELQEGAKKLEQGDFKQRINIKTKNELALLGRSFNQTISALEKTDEERKRIDHMKTQFISITSHELRSPMTPMKGQLQMLLQGYFGKLTKKQKESIEIVVNNTERLDNILKDFLEVSRIEAARLKFSYKKVNLQNNIANLIKEMKGFFPEKKIALINKVETLPVIEVDPDRTMQVMRNLLTNAIKFSKNKGKIIVGGKKKSNHILFWVQDFGEGLKEEDKDKVFEAFYQSEQTLARDHQGTGLGLTICTGIVKSQGGNIWVESKRGKGSTFYFTIPLKPAKEIQSIKVLFSGLYQKENAVKEVFLEYLGPIGESEFRIAKQRGLHYEQQINYINVLEKKGILQKHTRESMQKRFRAIYERREEGISTV